MALAAATAALLVVAAAAQVSAAAVRPNQRPPAAYDLAQCLLRVSPGRHCDKLLSMHSKPSTHPDLRNKPHKPTI
jgi:hypothetical protein